MPHTDKPTIVTQYILDLLKTKTGILGIPVADMYYGDQEQVPRTPSLAVETGTFSREMAGQGGSGRTHNTITVYVLVYLAKIQDVQVTRKSADQLAESVMTELHTDITMGGNVIHGFVTEIDPGYAVRSGVLLRAARITWQGITRTQI